MNKNDLTKLHRYKNDVLLIEEGIKEVKQFLESLEAISSTKCSVCALSSELMKENITKDTSKYCNYCPSDIRVMCQRYLTLKYSFRKFMKLFLKENELLLKAKQNSIEQLQDTLRRDMIDRV